MIKYPKDLVWFDVFCVSGFIDREPVWFRSERGHVWRGRYDSFENHKNMYGDYPVSIARRVEG